MSTLDDLVKKRDQLNARIKAEQAKERAAERKARNHALMVFGGLVEHATGGDWREIDYARLDALLHKSAESLRQTATEQGRGTKDATAALRAYEARKRELAKAKKEETTAS